MRPAPSTAPQSFSPEGRGGGPRPTAGPPDAFGGRHRRWTVKDRGRTGGGLSGPDSRPTPLPARPSFARPSPVWRPFARSSLVRPLPGAAFARCGACSRGLHGPDPRFRSGAPRSAICALRSRSAVPVPGPVPRSPIPDPRPRSPFPVPRSPFPVPRSPFPVPRSRLPDPRCGSLASDPRLAGGWLPGQCPKYWVLWSEGRSYNALPWFRLLCPDSVGKVSITKQGGDLVFSRKAATRASNPVRAHQAQGTGDPNPMG
jgi:hypothetical protein